MFNKLISTLGINRPSYPPMNSNQRPVLPSQPHHAEPSSRSTQRPDRRPATLRPRNIQPTAQRSELLRKAMQTSYVPAQGAEIKASDINALTMFLIDEFIDCGASKDQVGDSLKTHFEGIDEIFGLVEQRTKTRLGSFKFSAKKAVLQCALDKAHDKPMHVIEAFNNAKSFPDKHDMFIDVARNRMENDVRSYYAMPSTSGKTPVRRYLSHQLANLSQGDYVLHVCGLFNLENKIDREALDAIHDKIDHQYSNELSRVQRQGQPLKGVKFKHAIPYMLNCFPVTNAKQDMKLRNTHPASVMLRVASGFVFHPGHQNASLLDSNSPFAFENICNTMALKYFDAAHHDKLPEFFNTAFVAQQPCFEATVQNIMNYSSQPSATDTIFHTKPNWDDALSISDNVNGLLVWIEREMVRDFAKEKGIDLTSYSLDDINKIEGSRDFATFLMREKAKIETRTLEETKSRAPDAAVINMIQEDLELGLASTK